MEPEYLIFKANALHTLSMITLLISTVGQLLPIVCSFGLTAIIGNKLLQRWQQRSWLQQQQLLRGHKEIDDLRSTIEEFTTLAAKRSFRARRLVRILGKNDPDRAKEIRSEYYSAVDAWNDKLTFLEVRFTLFSPYSFSQRLEDDIQNLFADVNDDLDILLTEENTAERLKKRKAALETKLNQLNGKLWAFSRDAMNHLLRKQKISYSGREVSFSPETAGLFSTWYLFKALFKKQNPSQSIVGSLADPLVPTVVRL